MIDPIKCSLGRFDKPSESHAHGAAVRTRQEPFADTTVFFETTYNRQEREETCSEGSEYSKDELEIVVVAKAFIVCH